MESTEGSCFSGNSDGWYLGNTGWGDLYRTVATFSGQLSICNMREKEGWWLLMVVVVDEGPMEKARLILVVG